MKVKVTIWAEVDEDKYDATTDVQETLDLVIANLIDYDIDTNVPYREWEEDGLDWPED